MRHTFFDTFAHSSLDKSVHTERSKRSTSSLSKRRHHTRDASTTAFRGSLLDHVQSRRAVIRDPKRIQCHANVRLEHRSSLCSDSSDQTQAILHLQIHEANYSSSFY